MLLSLRKIAVDPFPHTPRPGLRKQIVDDTVSRCENRSGTEPFSAFSCVAPQAQQEDSRCVEIYISP